MLPIRTKEVEQVLPPMEVGRYFYCSGCGAATWAQHILLADQWEKYGVSIFRRRYVVFGTIKVLPHGSPSMAGLCQVCRTMWMPEPRGLLGVDDGVLTLGRCAARMGMCCPRAGKRV